MTTSEKFFGEILFTEYARKVLFPRKKKKIETNNSRTFSFSQLLSLPLLTVLLFLIMTHLTVSVHWLAFSHVYSDCK